MSAEKKEEAASAEKPAEAPAPKAPPPIGLILALLNIVAVLAALGTFVYTRILFKRPPITDDQERTRVLETAKKKTASSTTALVAFEPVTANIRSQPIDDVKPAAIQGAPAQLGKLHYVNFSFAVEINDPNRKEDIAEIKPLLLDRLLSAVGRKDFRELNSVQGRYLLRSQILDIVNDLVNKDHKDRGPLAVNVYFNQFVVQ